MISFVERYRGGLAPGSPACRQGIAPLLLLIAVTVPIAAAALPLTSFRYEAQAHRHCPADSVVWLDFRKEVYYLKRQKQFGRGFNGSFVCRNEARAAGFRRSLLGIR
jgi:hypothetical protein